MNNECPLGEEAWKCDLDQMPSMKSVYNPRGLSIVAEDNFRYPRTAITLTPDNFTMKVYEFKGMEDTLIQETNL